MSSPSGTRPNILVLMVDEMRYPTVYESDALKAFRRRFLQTQNRLRRNGVEFHRHYAASVACAPSRASLYTGQYPSLHGVTQTTGAAKAPHDPDVFWLDPGSVPTMGNFFRAAGYRTYWKGKWHVSEADLAVPGTHDALPSYDAKGAPDPEAERLYLASDRLGQYGFSGWIGPEPHGQAPLNSGSSAKGAIGRDAKFAGQVKRLIEDLDAGGDTTPFLVVASFVNPHDIVLYGLFGNLAGTFDFGIEDEVPRDLFDPILFGHSLNDNLATKPSCQASYQASYPLWMQPIRDRERYSRFYYQLHKNVDEDMATVLDALARSHFADNTIVVFTSDHGDLLGAHGDMHQKWHTAYDEAIRVPLIISNPRLFPEARQVEMPTSHVDLLPTLLGLAGIDAAAVRGEIAPKYSDCRELVGRDLSALVLGDAPAPAYPAPVFFMTDDEPTRGLNQVNAAGVRYQSVRQPNHIECVITQTVDGELWKYARYFDSPQFWSTPGTPGDPNVDVEDVTLEELGQPADGDGTQVVPFRRTVKHVPAPDEFELYNLTRDPLEVSNLAGNPAYAGLERHLAALLEEQRRVKALRPRSGTVPGEP